ncbi:hypothetical protein [Acinetobacter seifertii]|uniref:hypothetical protein n=2 Tax=Acinetobacter seifertii TaxID=1530123 RepID=UPI0006685852|nr:hypothetical protein [Acinetobacter seifertii]
MNLLGIIAKNYGLAVVDSVSFGFGSATRNSVQEFQQYVNQFNDALYLMQIETFLKTIELNENEVNNFFEKNPDNNRLGIGLLKILESFYLEKQAALLAINFQSYVKQEINIEKFNRYVNLIKKFDAHIFDLIEFDLKYSERLRNQGIQCEGLPKDKEDHYLCGIFETVGVSDSIDLRLIGLIEEEIKETPVTFSGSITPEKMRKRTYLYRDFYFDLYRKLK